MSRTSGRILRPFIALVTAGMFLLPSSAVADELTPAPDTVETVIEPAPSASTVTDFPEDEPEQSSPEGTSDTSTPIATDSVRDDANTDDDASPTPVDESTEADEQMITPYAAGPDGGNPPYVYWNVVDEAGNKIPGATFTLERRVPSGLFSETWGGSTNITDRFGSTSSTYDLDLDEGEFLVERMSNNHRISEERMRVRRQAPPEGYEWVTSASWVERSASAWDNGTLNFGDFEVRKIQHGAICEAGYVYGVSETGQIQQIDPNGTRRNIGGTPSGVSSFNGLGIAADSAVIYGYERSSLLGETGVSRAAIWRYNTETGEWTSTGASVNSNSSSRTAQFVAGAVALDTGRYYLGGFSTNGNVFRIWEYNSGSNSVVYKGQINTPGGSSTPGSNNGDMAFDSLGNLFVVRGTGNQTTVFSVTAADLAAANGGTINAAQAATVTTMNNVNGVAFDASGKAYLGSSGIIRSYDMPNWSNSTNVISSGLSSTDLATCSSPPTITIEKEVLGGRNAPTDQFELTLHQGSTLLDDTVTTGDETGIQSERLGPLPTVRGVELTFAEHEAGTTNLDHYASAYQCELTFQDGTVQTLDQVESTSGSIVIPANGEAVTCTFRNAPLSAHVNITKEVTDAAGENAQPRQNWTVGATMSPAAGSSVVSVPNQPTQQTAANGQAAWDFNFGSQDDSATLTVLEDMQDGYTFASGQCVVTSIEGAKEEHEITSPDETTLEGIVPGDRVDCTYTNKPAPNMLTVQKNIVGLAQPNDNFTISAHTGDDSAPGQQLGDSATTTQSGTDEGGLGLQEEVVGPVELVGHNADDIFWIREEAADGTDLSHYHSTFECVDTTPDSDWEAVSGELDVAGDYKQKSIGTIPVAENGQYANIECTIVNTPNPQLTLVKLVDNPEIGDGYAIPTDWNLSATVEGNTDPAIAGVTGFDEVTAQFVPAGTYTLDEAFGTTPDKSAGYQWTSLVCEDDEGAEFSDVSVTQDGGVVTDAAVQLGLQDNVTCTFTNTPILGSVTWTKVGEDGEPLGGSTWDLTGPGPDGKTVEVTETDHGQFTVENLPWGDYTVSELRAPAGYVLDATEREFTVNYANLAHVFTEPFVNEMREGPALPLTGGLGRDFFLAAGIGIAVIGLGTVGAMNLRNRRKEAA